MQSPFLILPAMIAAIAVSSESKHLAFPLNFIIALETAVCYTRELKDPRRDTFKAIFYTGLLCLFVYGMLPFAFQSYLGRGELARAAVFDSNGVLQSPAVYGGMLAPDIYSGTGVAAAELPLQVEAAVPRGVERNGGALAGLDHLTRDGLAAERWSLLHPEEPGCAGTSARGRGSSSAPIHRPRCTRRLCSRSPQSSWGR